MASKSTKCFFSLFLFLFLWGNAFAKDGVPNLFGSIEFKRPGSLEVWNEMLDRKSGHEIFSPERKIGKERWSALKKKALELKGLDRLRFVNSLWNQWPYREDIVNWGVADYWAAPYQFLSHSGDCEDYAIAKYFTLKELGVPVNSMRIVVVTDTVRNGQHAILAVYTSDGVYILDNLSKNVLPAKKIHNYKPHYSINENNRWAHVKGERIKGGS